MGKKEGDLLSLGEKLKAMIDEKGMTVNEVANKADVPSSNLYSIIKRNSTKVEIDNFIRICNVLGCRPEDFTEEILEASAKEKALLDLSEDEKTVVTQMRQCNSDGIRQIVRYAEFTASDPLFKKESDTVADEA